MITAISSTQPNRFKQSQSPKVHSQNTFKGTGYWLIEGTRGGEIPDATAKLNKLMGEIRQGKRADTFQLDPNPSRPHIIKFALSKTSPLYIYDTQQRRLIVGQEQEYTKNGPKNAIDRFLDELHTILTGKGQEPAKSNAQSVTVAKFSTKPQSRWRF